MTNHELHTLLALDRSSLPEDGRPEFNRLIFSRWQAGIQPPDLFPLPLPAAAQPQPGQLAGMGTGSAAGGQKPQPAAVCLHRLCHLPLVPCHGP